ncbi:Degradation activator [Limihaloglobus sulfuriphilus]|uniref:Degradation activator n=1 Tax=Limihaloglobus sulfuriphilus TaxID=1851148 RepID=A0A1Q2MGE0_9BACT|nr:LacI family DNA-binding transcriptional regulator [Limihaloglobus sulfuriphilus]AQQ71751.1 Degradation activator [Limihaloglobus sulfuriphilus]
MAATLKSIAAQAGVDVSVVSRVLNNKPKARVSDARRRQIKEIAQKLGYVPNGSAQVIRTGRFGCAALVQSGHQFRSYTPSNLLNGLHEELEAKDMHLLITRLPEDGYNDESELPKVFRTLMADGMIVNYNHHIPKNVLSLVKESSMPAVWLNTKRDTKAVYADCVKGGFEATSRLIELKHTRIAFIDIYFNDLQAGAHYSVLDRYIGYKHAMESAGLEPFNATPKHNIQERMSDQIEYFKAILTRPQRPTAFLLYWANAAAPLLTAARELGLSIPSDLSIITFASESATDQGLCVSAYIEPENEMGRSAVHLLNRLLEDKAAEIPSRVLDFYYQDLGTAARCERI